MSLLTFKNDFLQFSCDLYKKGFKRFVLGLFLPTVRSTTITSTTTTTANTTTVTTTTSATRSIHNTCSTTTIIYIPDIFIKLVVLLRVLLYTYTYIFTHIGCNLPLRDR